MAFLSCELETHFLPFWMVEWELEELLWKNLTVKPKTMIQSEQSYIVLCWSCPWVGF